MTRIPVRFLAVVLLLPALAGGLWATSQDTKSDVKKEKNKKEKVASPEKTENAEVTMGREAHEELVRSGIKLINDPALLERVNRIGQKLATVANSTVIPATYGTANTTPFAYKFHIIDDPDINAFALPGGYLYVHKALLNYVESDDELAGVLGHEIMHAAHKHVTRLQREQGKLNTQMALATLATLLARVPATDTGNILMGVQLLALQKVSGYSQNAEKDADAGGVLLAQKAGYNPVGALTFMERLERDRKRRPDVELGIYRTHPPEQVRVDNIVKEIKEMGLPINRRLTSNILKITIREKDKVQELLLDSTILFRANSVDRVKNAMSVLNPLLDTEPQVYEVKKRDNTVMFRGEVVFTITDDDARLAGKNLEETTTQVFKALQLAIYRYTAQKGI
jgi:beta-barrel assembly-enhancing protease